MLVEAGGHRYRDSVIVNVLDRDEMDAIFKPIWNGMKEKLGKQDIEGALGYFHLQSQDRYREIFTALSATLPAMAQEMQAIEIIYVNEMVAKYRIRKNEMYGGQMITLTYYIYFTRDENGMWAIEKF